MSEPYLGEIRLFAFNFPPRGWVQCNGQILPIESNQALYSIIGTAYGGDGRTTFGVPDLRGRVPIGVGTGFPLRARDGEEEHVLTEAETPSHTHSLNGLDTAATEANPNGHSLAQGPYRTSTANLVDLNASALLAAGSGQGFNVMQPWLAVNFCMAVEGTFPPRN